MYSQESSRIRLGAVESEVLGFASTPHNTALQVGRVVGELTTGFCYTERPVVRRLTRRLSLALLSDEMAFGCPVFLGRVRG